VKSSIHNFTVKENAFLSLVAHTVLQEVSMAFISNDVNQRAMLLGLLDKMRNCLGQSMTWKTFWSAEISNCNINCDWATSENTNTYTLIPTNVITLNNCSIGLQGYSFMLFDCRTAVHYCCTLLRSELDLICCLAVAPHVLNRYSCG